jgi:hypothetical protein
MDEFEEKIESLQKELNQITNSTTSTIKEETKEFNMLKSRIITYVILPFLILIVLFAWKPSLLLDDNKIEKKLSHTKLIVATIVLTIVINIIITFGVIVYKK